MRYQGKKRRKRRSYKKCYFTTHNFKYIDYKDVELLKKFIAKSGQILPRRNTGNCAKHQRMLACAVKRAREIALLPFVVD